VVNALLEPILQCVSRYTATRLVQPIVFATDVDQCRYCLPMTTASLSHSGAAEGNEKWGFKERALMASAGARAYNGGLGAEPPAGFRGRAPGQGVSGAKPP